MIGVSVPWHVVGTLGVATTHSQDGLGVDCDLGSWVF
jgi:hypothetical protein